MVSQPRQHGTCPRTLQTPDSPLFSHTRGSQKILLVPLFLVLLCTCMGPAAAYDCHNIQLVSIDVPITYEMGRVPLSAVVRGCDNECTYNWTLTREDGRLPPETYSGLDEPVPFNRPGNYRVDFMAIEQPMAPGGRADCPGPYTYAVSETRNIEITAPGHYGFGIDGICNSPPGKFATGFYAQLTADGPAHHPLAPPGRHSITAFPVQPYSCTNCIYSWTLKRSLTAAGYEPYEEIPLSEEYSYQQGFTGYLNYDFVQPGTYVATVTIRNPPFCGGDQYAAGTEKLEQVFTITGTSAQTGDTGMPGSPEVSPTLRSYDVLTTPGKTKYTGKEQASLEPVVTAIPMDMDPFSSSVKASAGGIFQKSSPASALTSANRTGNSSVPAQTKATPGFAPGLALCAGLIALLMIRRR